MINSFIETLQQRIPSIKRDIFRQQLMIEIIDRLKVSDSDQVEVLIDVFYYLITALENGDNNEKI